MSPEVDATSTHVPGVAVPPTAPTATPDPHDERRRDPALPDRRRCGQGIRSGRPASWAVPVAKSITAQEKEFFTVQEANTYGDRFGRVPIGARTYAHYNAWWLNGRLASI